MNTTNTSPTRIVAAVAGVVAVVIVVPVPVLVRVLLLVQLTWDKGSYVHITISMTHIATMHKNQKKCTRMSDYIFLV